MSKYEVRLFCGDCQTELNRTIAMTAEQIRNEWIRLVMGSGLTAGRCPKGCAPTFSDLNINTKLAIFDRDRNQPVEFADMEDEPEIAIPSTGDPGKDRELLEQAKLHDRRMKQNLCPNGCGRMTITDAHNRDCPACGFHGWSNVPHGFEAKV